MKDDGDDGGMKADGGGGSPAPTAAWGEGEGGGVEASRRGSTFSMFMLFRVM